MRCLASHQGALTHIGADHRDHPSCIENDGCSFRIVVDVGFRGPFTLPPVIEPPMMMMFFTSGTMEGSFETASAIFVNGPTGISVTSCGYLCASSMMRSGPKRESALHFEAGSSTPARPFGPCQYCAVISFWLRGCVAPPPP